MSETPLRVYVVDDHPVVLEGLSMALGRFDDLEIVGLATSGEDALSDFDSGIVPDVVVVDACLPGLSGPDLCGLLRERLPGAKCLVLTATLDTYLLRAAIEADARGYLVKDAAVGEIVDAIRKVHAGEIVLDRRATGMVVTHLRMPDRPRVVLTAREQDLVDYLALGLSNPQIARELRISVNTAKSYVSRLLTKLDVPTRTAAVARAAELGLLQPTQDPSPWRR